MDRLLTVKHSDATNRSQRSGSPPALATQRFEQIAIRGLEYKQRVSTQMDYTVQPLLPYMISSHGPALAVADVNGDGRPDLFVGGRLTPRNYP